MKRIFTLSIVLLTAVCGSLVTAPVMSAAIYRPAEKLLEIDCVRILSAGGAVASAWQVGLALGTDARGSLQLVLSAASRYTTIPVDCPVSFQTAPDGSYGDLTVQGLTVEGAQGLTYDLQARAILPPVSGYVFSISSLVKQELPANGSFTLVFAASENGDADCSFGNVEECRLYSLQVAVTRDTDGNVAAITPDAGSFRELLEGKGAVMPDVSPDGRRVAFLSTEVSGALHFRSTYVLDLESGNLLDVTSGQTLNDQGDWPHWISDDELMYSNINYCPDGASSPGCSTESRFSDLMLAQLSEDRSSVTSTAFLFGASDASGFDSSACDASDSVFNPGSASMIAFHSTTIDGKTTVHDGSCPWLEGFPGFNGEDYAGPKPVVWNLNAIMGKQNISEAVAGEDYFLFDMAPVGINSLAHLYFAPDQTILGTEQNTVEFPFRACSIESVVLTEGLAACQDAGGKILLYNRIFGFENTGSEYENLRRADHPRKPLFTHWHPQSLPGAERYYDPANTGDNFQYKYAEFMQSSTLILATVMSHDTNDTAIAFSRLMFIDFADPDAPYYFDLTGWLEDTFPDRWAPGSARGFTGTAMP